MIDLTVCDICNNEIDLSDYKEEIRWVDGLGHVHKECFEDT